jgi:hypothetical protein
MPDHDGMVRNTELRAWGVLGRPPEGLERAHRDLVLAWKKLYRDAQAVLRMRGGRKLAKAKEIEARRAQLVRDIEFNVRLLNQQEKNHGNPGA